MSDSAYSLLTTLTRFRRPDMPVWVALRNTAAVVAPLAIGFVTGHTLVGLGVGAGALNVMFADQPGPYAQRLTLIVLVSIAAALSGLVGFLAGNHPDLLLPVYALWGFGGGMLVLYGPRMSRVGMTSMILLIVATATPRHWHQALAASGLILAGGALQALFSVAAWPLRRYRPERLALASVYRDLAHMARQQSRHDDVPPVSDTMTQLQQTLLGRTYTRSRAMEAFQTLLELAERSRLELMALAELAPDSAALRHYHQAVARVLQAIVQALEKAEPPKRAERALEALKAIDDHLADDDHDPDLLSHAHALTGQLAAAARNANWASSRGEIRARKADTAMPRALRNTAPLATLRANLRFSSVAFRHAVRLAVVLVLAGLISRHTGIEHAYWLPMTAAIVLRPDFGATFNTGWLRMLGTIAGLLLTTALLFVTPQNLWAHLALMAVLCFTFRYLATAHYGVAVVALTGTVVILLSFEGIASDAAASERVIQTVLGCALALLAYRIWPTWERGRAREALATLLEAYADYLGALTIPDTANIHRDARTAARAARSNAQASLDRLRAEPGTDTKLIELATALFVAANRLVRTAMALEALFEDCATPPGADTTMRFLQSANQHLRELANAVREQRAPRPLPPLREQQQALAAQLHAGPGMPMADHLIVLSDRLTNNTNTLAHVLANAHARPPTSPT